MFNNINELIDSYFENHLYNKPTDLCQLFNGYGSDKGNHHNYSTFYDYIFSPIKDEKMNVFEVGLGTNNVSIPSNMGAHGRPGASLRGWRDYFKNSMIYGADVDQGCLFEEERIKTYYTDQTNKEVIDQCWNQSELKGIEFDILIDDGLHEYNANRNFFTNSCHKLKKGGIYILEDISEQYSDNVQNWFNELIDSNEYYFVKLITLPISGSVQENNRLGVIVK